MAKTNIPITYIWLSMFCSYKRRLEIIVFCC